MPSVFDRADGGIVTMGNKGFINKAKSGQKALPAKLKRAKGQAAPVPPGKRRQPSQ